jgi:membrane protein YqaA with SNARE-associated domain
MKKESEKFHQKAYHHVKKHRKKYMRFILFFIFLLLFRIIEDYFLLTSPVFEVEFDVVIFLIVILSAIVFTIVAEATEIFIEEKEAKKLLKFITKKEKMIKRKIKA